MKTLEQLGISPAPWRHTPADEWTHAGIDDANGCGVGETYQVAGKDETAETANACICAAAPELYKRLREAVVEVCHDCPYCGARPDYKCSNKNCLGLATLWRAALAKAAGESEVSK